MKVYLTPQHQARVTFKIAEPDIVKVNCLVDTGFSGGLALSEKLLTKFAFKPIAFQEFELADGSLLDFAIYEGMVAFGKDRKKISILFTKSDDNW